MIRRATFVFLVALGVVAAAPCADAHSVLRSSDPQSRAVLAQAPSVVTLAFTEAPEVSLSAVQVLDRSGGSFGIGKVEGVAGDAETVRLRLRPLPKGVYSVNWRVVSRVDGHLTAGTVTFGVQEAVTDIEETPAASAPSNQSPLAIGGRAAFYVGICALVGVAWVGTVAFRGRRRGLLAAAAGGWAVALVGVLALGRAQQQTGAVGLSDFLASSLGRAVLWRGAGALMAGVGLLVGLGASRRRHAAGIALVTIGSLVAVVAHVHTSHAAAASASGLMVALQCVHFLAAAVWIGGLGALLVGLRGDPSAEKALAARRYSFGAGVSLAVLASTGVIRAIDEVGSWHSLTRSTYGRLVLVKAALLVALGALGAINRFRNVPAASRSLRGLRRIGTAELSVTLAVFAATGLLTTEPPPARATVPKPSVVVAEGSDFGTTIRVRLSATPGKAGENNFAVALTDYDSGEPVRADRVGARFTLPANPEASETTLDFLEGSPGRWSATGSNLSLPGRWRVTVVVERELRSLELPLDLVTAPPAYKVTQARATDLTIYTVSIEQGRSLQVYVDPERPGPSQLHATFFAEGGELPVQSATITTSTPKGQPQTSTPRRLGPGHFVTDAETPRGTWTIEATAVTDSGEYLFVPLVVTIPG